MRWKLHYLITGTHLGKEHDKYVAWFERRLGRRDPAIESQLLIAVNAFDAIEESDSLSLKDLKHVVEAASSPHAMLWMNGSDLLKRLSERWFEAALAIVDMFKSPKANVRFSAICSLGTGTPREIIHVVLGGGLKDKSARVRWKAADHSLHIVERALIPDLTAALASERHAKARKTMEFCLPLLRDGYALKPESKGGHWITIRISTGIRGKWVSKEELKSKGINLIVAEAQKE